LQQTENAHVARSIGETAMRIKLKQKVMVGTPSAVRAKGWVGEVDNDEAKALVAVGYAVETKDALTDEAPAAAAAAEVEVVEAEKPKNNKQK
jgi:hypothetical protein